MARVRTARQVRSKRSKCQCRCCARRLFA
jgi:hypothetical protein